MLCAALMGTPMAAQDLPVVGENLVTNGSFEQSPVGPVAAGEVPEGWWREAYGADGQLEIVAGGAPGQGQRCLTISTDPLNSSSGLHGELVRIDPAKAYLQSGWARVEPPGASSGLMLGRQWFDAEQEPLAQEHSRSYNYVATHLSPEGWASYEQLLIPDRTPDDGRFAANEIPAGARYLRVWAICFQWAGEGYFDGLALHEVDYARMARERIAGMLEEANAAATRAEIEAALHELPKDTEAAERARELLGELNRLRKRLEGEGQPVSEWIADEQRAPELVEELDDVRWRLKIEALLGEAG